MGLSQDFRGYLACCASNHGRSPSGLLGFYVMRRPINGSSRTTGKPGMSATPVLRQAVFGTIEDQFPSAMANAKGFLRGWKSTKARFQVAWYS